MRERRDRQWKPSVLPSLTLSACQIRGKILYQNPVRIRAQVNALQRPLNRQISSKPLQITLYRRTESLNLLFSRFHDALPLLFKRGLDALLVFRAVMFSLFADLLNLGIEPCQPRLNGAQP